MAVAQFIWAERTLVENHIGNFKNVRKRDDVEATGRQEAAGQDEVPVYIFRDNICCRTHKFT